MRYILAVAFILTSSTVFAGECANGKCRLRSRTVNDTREIVQVPVQVTRRTLTVRLS